MSYDITRIQSVLSTVWPDWRITKRLGKGSYGTVYEIIRDDLGSGYKCALKVLEMQADDITLGGDPTVRVLNPDAPVSQNPYRRSGGASASNIYNSLSRKEGRQQGALNSEYEAARKNQGQQFLQASRKTPSGIRGLTDESQADMLEDFVRSVSQEIDLMMKLKGTPNVVSIEDYTVLRGRNSRMILIRMELLQGVDKIAELNQGMDQADVIRLGIDICSALVRCEKKHILHRDIKPSNIFYSENAGYKLGDFGISRTMASLHEKMSMSGVGTIQYMAPEVYLGEKYNHTIDIYSLGLTLYTLLNNNNPPLYSPEDPVQSGGSADTGGTNRRREANMKRLRGETLPAPANADSRLSAVILTACSADPSQRFQNAAAFRSALEDCLDPPHPAPVPTPVTEPVHSPVNKYLLAAGIALLVLAGVLFFNRNSKVDTSDPPSDAASGSVSAPGSGSDSVTTAEEVTYYVVYQDSEGNTLNEEEYSGDAGETLDISASPPDGYTAEETTQSLTLSESSEENRVVFHCSSIYIEWTDKNLESAVKSQLGISGDMTLEQASRVTTLNLESSYVSDISDLQYFTGLKTLNLADNYIQDLSPLSEITGLHELNLEKNADISDVTPLRNLIELRTLDLNMNKVSDISSLSGLTKLNKLDLRENNVSDISACSDMLVMHELYLTSNTGINDISAVSKMKELWYLSVKNTNVSDLSPLKTIDSLTTLILANSNVTSLEPVRNLPILGYLDIRGCSIKSTDALNQLRKKKDLKIDG